VQKSTVGWGSEGRACTASPGPATFGAPSDHPVPHHQPAVRHFGKFLVVGYDHEGLAQFLAQVEEELVELLGVGGSVRTLLFPMHVAFCGWIAFIFT